MWLISYFSWAVLGIQGWTKKPWLSGAWPSSTFPWGRTRGHGREGFPVGHVMHLTGARLWDAFSAPLLPWGPESPTSGSPRGRPSVRTLTLEGPLLMHSPGTTHRQDVSNWSRPPSCCLPAGCVPESRADMPGATSYTPGGPLLPQSVKIEDKTTCLLGLLAS